MANIMYNTVYAENAQILEYFAENYNGWIDEEETTIVKFSTSWSAPLSDFELICQKYPESCIRFRCVLSEGGGYVVNEYINMNGQLELVDAQVVDLSE